MKNLDVEPVIKNLYLKGDYIIDKKIKNAIKKGYISKDNEENIRKLCQTIITEYLHVPSKQLKNISKNMECDLVTSVVQNMFTESTNSENSLKCEHLTKN